MHYQTPYGINRHQTEHKSYFYHGPRLGPLTQIIRGGESHDDGCSQCRQYLELHIALTGAIGDHLSISLPSGTSTTTAQALIVTEPVWTKD
jgi:hypothetical protein